MELKSFDKLGKRDFENGAVLDEIREIFKERDELYEVCKAIVRDFEDEDDPLIIPASSCIHIPNHSDLCPYWLAKQALDKIEGGKPT